MPDPPWGFSEDPILRSGSWLLTGRSAESSQQIRWKSTGTSQLWLGNLYVYRASIKG